MSAYTTNLGLKYLPSNSDVDLPGAFNENMLLLDDAFSAAYSAIVYVDGSMIVAENADGRVVATGVAGVADLTVIQAAYDSLGSNELLRIVGEFTISDILGTFDVLDLSTAKTIISGPAKINCVINNVSQSTAYFSIGADYIEVSGIEFKWNYGSIVGGHSAIYSNANYSHVHDNIFSGVGGSAFETLNDTPIKIGCNIHSNKIIDSNGIFLHKCHFSSIHDNIFMDVPFYAIQLYNSVENVHVFCNTIINSNSTYITSGHNYGIMLGHNSTEPGTVLNNLVEMNLLNNVWVGIYNNIDCLGNRINKNQLIFDVAGADSGIATASGSDAIIEGNYISASGVSGFSSIVINGADVVYINDNILKQESSESWSIACNMNSSTPGKATINNNIIKSVISRGISLGYINGGQIIGNVINVGGDYGIYVAYSDRPVSLLKIAYNDLSGADSRDIFLGAYASSNDIIYNNITSFYNDGGLYNVVLHNRGHVTEISGSTSGTGSQQTIAHGLVVAPTRAYIYIPSTGEFVGVASDATNIYPNVPLSVAYNWNAEV